MSQACDLTKGSPAKVIVLFSLPIILGNVFQQLYAMVDSAIVGRFVSYQALAGLGAVNGLTFIITGFILGTTGGFGIRIAQRFGAKDLAGMRRSIGTAIELSLLITILLTAASLLAIRPVLTMMQTPADIFGYSSAYLCIIFAGMFSQFAYNLVACILRAVGDSRTPLCFIIISSILNLALDILMVAKLGQGVRGAAFATVTAQMCSAIACFIFAFKRFPELRLSVLDFRIETDEIKEQLRLGLPMAFQFSITGIGLILLQLALNKFPTSYIAGFTAANKIQNVAALIGISLGVATANFTGQNFGASKMERVRAGVRSGVVISLGVCLLTGIGMALNTDCLSSLFMENPSDEVLYASGLYMKMSALFLPFLYLLLIYRNALQGMGRTFWPLMGGFLELAIRAAVSIWLPGRIGYLGVALVDVLAWTGACLMLAICYYKFTRK